MFLPVRGTFVLYMGHGQMIGLGRISDALCFWSRHLVFRKPEKDKRDDIGSLNEYRPQQRFRVREIASTFWLFLIYNAQFMATATL